MYTFANTSLALWTLFKEHPRLSLIIDSSDEVRAELVKTSSGLTLVPTIQSAKYRDIKRYIKIHITPQSTAYFAGKATSCTLHLNQCFALMRCLSVDRQRKFMHLHIINYMLTNIEALVLDEFLEQARFPENSDLIIGIADLIIKQSVLYDFDEILCTLDLVDPRIHWLAWAKKILAVV